MASQYSNARKGAYAPYGRWVPKRRHCAEELQRQLRLVEAQRRELAIFLAKKEHTERQIIAHVVRQELERAQAREVKFYKTDDSVITYSTLTLS